MTAVHKAPGDYPGGKKGDVLTVEFTVLGIPCLGLNGGPMFKHSEAFSFQIATDNQEETDRYWNAIVGNGGKESECGWCKDRWGLSWQITPRTLTDALAAGGGEAKRAFEAMMTMRKIDIATIEAAAGLTYTTFVGSRDALSSQARRHRQLCKLFVCQIAIAEDLPEQSGADRFAGVDGNGRDAAIGMPHTMMAALDADDREADLFRARISSLPVSLLRRAIGGHVNCTCWTATKVRRGGRGPSARQSVMASATRFVSTSSDLACV